ncbi:hypothetical protein [Streptomyces sp. SAS_260]|uniref:hypothetical protein n=1 Tax=Streptomyces sp. SAS_260 TaxID=3412751 RepID=UPI00403C1BBB
MVDVDAVSGRFCSGELEALGVCRPEEFGVRELRDRLESVVRVSDAGFGACGLGPGRVAELRYWARCRRDGLARRLAGPFAGSDDIGGYWSADGLAARLLGEADDPGLG